MRKKTAQQELPKATIGWREWACLPDLEIAHIKMKVDTGARTSALHAHSMQRYTEAGAPWARLEIRPHQEHNETVTAHMPVIDERNVRDSGGHVERRIVIETRLQLGSYIWPIELTVTNRDSMRFRMLLGRTAMENRFVVDPAQSYLLGPAPE